MKTSTSFLSRAVPAVVCASLAACAAGSPSPASDDVATTSSRLAHDCDPPDPPQGNDEADRAELVAGNTAFALDLYRSIAWQEENAGRNVFFSPYSISLALAMTYAGAGGDTATQLARALHFTLPPSRLHPAFGALDAELERRGDEAHSASQHPFRLHVASSLWAQRTLSFEPAFLETLGEDYGSSLDRVDFARDPDGARVAMNQWVSDRTDGKIPDLFAPGSIGRDARLVLADAIDFDAGWAEPFDPSQTADGPFHCADGTTKTVPLMHQWAELSYAEGDGWQAVVLPYQGGHLGMVVILPAHGRFDDVEGALDARQLAARSDGFGLAGVTLTMPKFTLDPGTVSLRDRLRDLGVRDAFDTAHADFSGITKSERVAIGDVVHRAFIDVDEHGTQAAAATGVVVVGTSIPARQATVTIDRPFLYAILDGDTGTILFVGRTMAP